MLLTFVFWIALTLLVPCLIGVGYSAAKVLEEWQRVMVNRVTRFGLRLEVGGSSLIFAGEVTRMAW